VVERESLAEERGSSLSGRSSARGSVNLLEGPEKRGEPKMADQRRVHGAPLLRQHQRLSINHSRSAPLRSLSRLLAHVRSRARSLANGLQKCDRTANTAPSLRVYVYAGPVPRDYDRILRSSRSAATRRRSRRTAAHPSRFLQLTPVLIEFRPRRVSRRSATRRSDVDVVVSLLVILFANNDERAGRARSLKLPARSSGWPVSPICRGIGFERAST